MNTSTNTTATTEQLIAQIEDMSPAELRDRYRDLYGEETRSGNRRWLIRRISWREQAVREGGLTQRAMNRAEELARDEDLRVRPPKTDEPTAGAGLRTIEGPMAKRDPRLPIPGTILKRVYQGTEHQVTVLREGFEHQGTVYRSLTAAAFAITGTHWNGMLFFGLAKTRKKTVQRAKAEDAT